MLIKEKFKTVCSLAVLLLISMDLKKNERLKPIQFWRFVEHIKAPHGRLKINCQNSTTFLCSTKIHVSAKIHVSKIPLWLRQIKTQIVRKWCDEKYFIHTIIYKIGYLSTEFFILFFIHKFKSACLLYWNSKNEINFCHFRSDTNPFLFYERKKYIKRFGSFNKFQFLENSCKFKIWYGLKRKKNRSVIFCDKYEFHFLKNYKKDSSTAKNLIEWFVFQKKLVWK